MIFFYKIGVALFGLVIHIASLFSEKAKQWVEGREIIQQTLSQISLSETTLSQNQWEDKPIWIHSASLGEFEQARPIVDRLKEEFPDQKILLTFFSSSGYIPRKNYRNADYVTYLPLDTPKNAEEFVSKVQAKLVIWIKYDLWYFHLIEIQKRNIPLVLVAANFWSSQIYFRPYGTFYKKALNGFNHIFVQNVSSIEVLQKHGYENVSLAPDTRFDRVLTVANQAQEIPILDLFKNGEPMLVAGSTWPKDEVLLARFIQSVKQAPKLLIVPHEINESHINSIVQLFDGEVQRFSQCRKEDLPKTRVLILDTMGMLSSAYRYGEYAFIGGGFGKGIHNILEAVVYGVPIFIGPKYKIFQEANDLVKAKTVFPVNTVDELVQQFEAIKKPVSLENISKKQQDYIHSNIGGTEILVNYLTNHKLLTNSQK